MNSLKANAQPSRLMQRGKRAQVVCAAQQTIRIKLKSYHVELLDQACAEIRSVVSETGATLAGPVPLPMNKKIYCVLRSPHVNKNSMEHFEIRTHKRLVDIKDINSTTVDRLMGLDLPAGVDVKVSV